MLCINKRLYWSYRCHRADGRYGAGAGAGAGRLLFARGVGGKRRSGDLRPQCDPGGYRRFAYAEYRAGHYFADGHILRALCRHNHAYVVDVSRKQSDQFYHKRTDAERGHFADSIQRKLPAAYGCVAVVQRDFSACNARGRFQRRNVPLFRRFAQCVQGGG